MSNINETGKLLMVIGAVLVVVGGILALGVKIPYLGRLPGDVIIRKKNFVFYFPIATSLLISLALTLIFYLWGKK